VSLFRVNEKLPNREDLRVSLTMEAAGIEISPATIRTRSQVSLGPRCRVLRLSRPAPDAISWSLTVA